MLFRDYFLQFNDDCPLTVVVDGIDKGGKATLVANLQAHLEARHLTVETVEFPYQSGDPVPSLYDKIYEMLEDGTAKRHPQLFSGCQFANRIEWQSKIGISTMTADLILFDRWDVAHYAYGKAAGLTDEEVAVYEGLLLEPDLYIILNGKPFSDKVEDCYEEPAFQKEVRKHYLDWYEKNKSKKQIHYIDLDTLTPQQRTKDGMLQMALNALDDNWCYRRLVDGGLPSVMFPRSKDTTRHATFLRLQEDIGSGLLTKQNNLNGLGGIVLKGFDLSGDDLSNMDFGHGVFEDVNFDGANLSGCIFEHASFTRCSFVGCFVPMAASNLAYADHYDCRFF